MRLAIDDNGFKLASPNRVYNFLEGKHSIDTVRQWSDAVRASFNVYRVVDTRNQGDEFQTPGNTTLVRVGDVVEWRANAADVSLGRAQARMHALLAIQLNAVANGGVDISGFPVKTDSESITEYNLFQNAVDAGEPFPAGGIPILLMDGTKFKANLVQWGLLLRGVGVHRINCNNRWDALTDSVNAATSVADVRAVFNVYQTGWPANPSI